MNIFLSKKIQNLYFFENAVTIPLIPQKVETNMGISYICYCICNNINSVELIAEKIKEKFNIAASTDEIEKHILANTIDNKDIGDAFTMEVEKANLYPKFNGNFGQKYPSILHLELTGTCNFYCGHCYKNATSNGCYIDYEELKEKIYQRFKNIIPVVHFTGGEPTLHKKFGEIVDLFSNGFHLQLTTNGSRIYTYPIEVFKHFQAIDISLYGLSANEYKMNTGNSDSYEYVKRSIAMLRTANIDFGITLVINNDNWKQLEQYIKFGIEFGATNISFALPSRSGRLLTSLSDKWYLERETMKNIYREYRNIKTVYKDKIKIKEWHRSGYFDMWKSYPLDDSLRCGAGKNSWWMSERFAFRPCPYLPEQYISLDYDTWYNYITGKQTIDWKEARDSLEVFANQRGLNINDICSIFRK